MVQSMTGFAAATGAFENVRWTIEIRGVNAKGLDIRVRVPEKMAVFETKIKGILGTKLARGNVNVTVKSEIETSQSPIKVDERVLSGYLDAIVQVRTRARGIGLKLQASTAAEILDLKGVLVASDDAAGELPSDDILSMIDGVAEDFVAMRMREGAELERVLTGQIDRIGTLTAQARDIAALRKDHMAQALRTNLERVLGNTDGVDEARLAQELAHLAVKSDITEEIDRLHAHVAGARKLLSEDGAIGRKLDFLMQEFNREANTLCSKSQYTELTQVGLDLKAVIDQMREQVQNVE